MSKTKTKPKTQRLTLKTLFNDVDIIEQGIINRLEEIWERIHDFWERIHDLRNNLIVLNGEQVETKERLTKLEKAAPGKYFKYYLLGVLVTLASNAILTYFPLPF